MKRLYGLIGFPLGHSFSQRFFRDKFRKENIQGVDYQLFEIKEAEQLRTLMDQNPHLQGLNVTIPHKQSVIPLLDTLDPMAQKIGAVNTIKRLADGRLKGYNTDYWGFSWSLQKHLTTSLKTSNALILGNGGATQAIKAVLQDLSIPFMIVSRHPDSSMISYQDLSTTLVQGHCLIINCTPLGMHPNIDTAPDIPYHALTSKHLIYDLVYNPEVTKMMHLSIAQGAQAVNGLEMLHLQAEKAWEIWQR